jgi:hypothetical protein
MVRNIRYRLLNCEIQDWVQLPTKPEMDVWRDENTPGWRNKFRVVTTIIVTPTKEQIYEYERLGV